MKSKVIDCYWLLLSTNATIFQLYHGEKMFIFNEMMMKSALYKTNTPTWIASSLKQQYADKHVAPTGTYFPDSEPTGICSFSLMLRA
jgi:hypothetical protein